MDAAGGSVRQLSDFDRDVEGFGISPRGDKAWYVQRVQVAARRSADIHKDMPESPGARAAFVAGRFAAKEAAVKALGTGFAEGVSMRDVEVLRLPSGRPELRFSGAAARRAEELGVKAVHVSLTHERDVAGAVVVLEG